MSEFKLQSYQHVLLQIKIFAKGMNFFILPIMASIVSLLFFYEGCFGIK